MWGLLGAQELAQGLLAAQACLHIPLQWPWKGILLCLPQVLVSSPLVSQTAQGLGGCRVLLGTWLSNGDPRELYPGGR